jgi:hypothetical protein
MLKTFKTTIVRDGSTCFIPLTFDPKAVFGKVRAPVKVTLNGYTYRSTIAAMGGPACVPLRRSNREAAGLEGGETVTVSLALDTEKREVKAPPDLVRALKASPPAWDRWQAASYSHQREHAESVEQAKKAETRARRIAGVVEWAAGLSSRKPRTPSSRSGAAERGGMMSTEGRPMNSAWHKSHPMPRPATPAQRVAWHLAHQRQCSCRAIPASVQRLIEEKAGGVRRASRPAASARRSR